MAQYYVEWRIEIEADSPEDAARQALAIQQDPDSIANVFHIADADEGFIVIDLSELDQEAASHGKV